MGIAMEQAMSRPEPWTMVRQALRRRVGDARFKSWFANVRLVSQEGGTVVLAAPSAFIARFIQAEHIDDLREAWTWADPSVQRVELVIDAANEDAESGDSGDADAGRRPTRARAAQAAAAATTVRRLSDEAPRDGRGFGYLGGGRQAARQSFDTFFVGVSNQVAYHSARKFVEAPDDELEMLQFVGRCGVGKSHLLNSIARGRLDVAPQERVRVLSASAFLTDFMSALKNRATLTFKAQVQDADLLLIDDIHLLIGKQATQEELIETIDTIIARGGRVVTTSAYPLTKDLAIDERLLSRLRGGVQVEIQAPDLELRRRVLRRKVEIARERAPSVVIADDMIEVLARHGGQDVRSLCGALDTVVVEASGLGVAADAELARRVLRTTYQEPERRIGIADVQRATCKYFDLPIEELLSKRRTVAVARPRQIAMYLCRDLTRKSLPEIGRGFSRDHTTVVHAIRRIDALRSESPEIDAQVQAIRAMLERPGADGD